MFKNKEDLKAFLAAVACTAIFFVTVGLLASPMLPPRCPNCDHFVTSAFCSDCGWEAVRERPTLCPECGDLCNTAFCKDCGTAVTANQG